MVKLVKIFTFFLIASLAMGTSPNLGRPPKAKSDLNENLRESCRRLISGRYMALYDEALQARRFVQVLENQKSKLNIALAKEKQKLGVLEAAAATGEFDANKATARDVKLGSVGNIEDQIKMLTAEMDRAERAAVLKSADEATMKRRLPPVFKISEFKGEKNQKGYSFRVDFVSTCPRYQYQCPLPDGQGRALTAMLPGEDLPTECQRYASIHPVN